MHEVFLGNAGANGLTSRGANFGATPWDQAFDAVATTAAEGRRMSGRRTLKLLVRSVLLSVTVGMTLLSDSRADDAAKGRRGSESLSAPLWKRSIDRANETAGFLSCRVHTFTRVSDGGGKQLGTIKQTDELDLSKGVESPSWKISTKSFTGSPGLRFEADFGLQKDPRLVFEGYDRWSFVGREIQEGMSIEVWEGVSADDPKKRITAHIDADSAWLLKAEFTFPFRFPLGSMLVKAALVCSPTSEGIWLPTRMTVDQGGRILLMTRQIVMEKTYTEWSRPAATNLPTETVGSQKNQTTNKR